ncbi:Protein tyrosine kinase [Oopsacas minuta]|uniref:Protein tyrosine kinase n=1 Tax=Oopsacas minuta TaxID=111878 RepID=A0AAV7JQN1_9METZ|nr:Protein tyrosine kinase [Oopsacas minuta]
MVLPGISNLQDRNSLTGWVALHEAVVHGHSDVVEILLHHGAPSRPRTPDADIPYSLAERYNKVDIMEILERFEVDKPAPLTTSVEWLHPNLSREDANNLLEANGLSQGLFLVRPNSKRAGYYALSLVDNKIPYHFVIVSLADQWFYIDDGPIFSNLPSIVAHYSKFADGLPTTLKMAVCPLKSHGLHSNSGFTPIDAKSINRSHRTAYCSSNTNTSRFQNHLPPIASDYSHISEWMNDNFIKLTQKIPIIDSSQLQLYNEIGSGEFGAVSL